MPKSHDWACRCHGLQEAPSELGNQQCNTEHNRVVAVLPRRAEKRGLERWVLPSGTSHPLILGIITPLPNGCFEGSVTSSLCKTNWL